MVGKKCWKKMVGKNGEKINFGKKMVGKNDEKMVGKMVGKNSGKK